MRAKCLTNPTKGVFVQNRTFPHSYELPQESGANLPFSYFTLSTPKESYLRAQRAVFVAESLLNESKVLHTGLRPTKNRFIFSGDTTNPTTKEKSLLLFRLNPSVNGYDVFLFAGYYPKSLTRAIKYIQAL